MDQELREAERAGDYQRMYSILNRAGRHDEAHNLILDHPIAVECVVRYRYEITWADCVGVYGMPNHESLQDYSLNQLIERFITKNAGAAQVVSVERKPVYTLLGEEFSPGIFSGSGPLKLIRLSCGELHSIKNKVKHHPDYMRGASAEQLAEAADADERDAERARRQIDKERNEAEARQRKQDILNKFEQDSRQLKQKVWKSWEAHRELPRPEFARTIYNHSIQFILFRMKDAADCAPLTFSDIARARPYFDKLWQDNHNKRFAHWKQENKTYIDSLRRA